MPLRPWPCPGGHMCMTNSTCVPLPCASQALRSVGWGVVMEEQEKLEDAAVADGPGVPSCDSHLLPPALPLTQTPGVFKVSDLLRLRSSLERTVQVSCLLLPPTPLTPSPPALPSPDPLGTCL